MKTMLILSIIITLATVGFIAYNNTKNFEPTAMEESIIPEGIVLADKDSTSEFEITSLPNEEHPHSLPSIMDAELEGRDFTVGQVLSNAANYTRYFITYSSEGRKVSGIMNVPKGEGPYPVLFLNHGFIDPSVYTNGRGLKREQDFFARNGYVVIHSDYRGHAQSDPFPEGEAGQRFGYNGYTIDVLNAMVAIQKADLSYVAAERIGLLGHSMGGGITQNVLVTHPELLSAAVLYAPVSTDYQNNFFKWRREDFSPERIEEIESTFGSIDKTETFSAFSSATYVENIEDPIQIYHGTADDSVPLDWSRATVELFSNNDIDIELIEYPGEGHEFSTRWSDFMLGSLEFFNQHL